jgi:hypothetical protein
MTAFEPRVSQAGKIEKDGCPPDAAVRPAALNAGFAPHCRRSDARGLTSQIDPKQTLRINSADFA